MNPVERGAVITGASSGIGRATARVLRGMGYGVVLTARRGDRLEMLVDELGEGAVCLAGDMLDEGLAEELVGKAVEAFGRCDVVVNNAGMIEAGSIEGIDIDRVCMMVRVNVEAAFRMAYVALRHFRGVGRGHLINISSVLGTKVRPTAGAYAGTKYAIEALSEALRMEVAKSDIQVSCIEPGLVMTGLHDRWAVHPRESMDIAEPLRPEDVARGIRYLLEQPSHVRIPRLMLTPRDHVI